jgi:hypothetical protein
MGNTDMTDSEIKHFFNLLFVLSVDNIQIWPKTNKSGTDDIEKECVIDCGRA